MDLKVFTEGNEDINRELTNGYKEVELSSLTEKKQCEAATCNTSINESMAPRIKSVVHLVKEENKIMEYKLNLKDSNGKESRVYEVENLVIGKPTEYLFKNTILNIIRYKLKEAFTNEIIFDSEEKILENYKNQLKEILKQ
ncbi:hypothetical protein J2Z44_000491 [Clostridium punense]|uniref:Uncharacterized protein n=1 Tax=Clostridium punense TaxID=1054297 RepID=A0ABS4JYU2_9CLOT|nr:MULTISPECIES: hypothetical protein [Clostridium]EQB87461.1 hypothetical protein M918_08690 [Clostridium sp. BL8]MBP2020707.1 hypothetical protein [Clostridium punense]